MATDVSTPEARLERVVEDLQLMREEWIAMGRPSTAQGSSGGVIPHPLIGMIRRAEAMALRMQLRIDGVGPGRRRGQGSAPDRRF